MSDEPTKTFEDLQAWKTARVLRTFVFRKVAPLLKVHHEYDLISQIKRSARSVGNNIAEGHGRFHYRDNYRFCSQSRGSLMETLDHFITCHDDDLIDDALYNEARGLFENCLKPLNGYMSWLQRRANETSVRPPN